MGRSNLKITIMTIKIYFQTLRVAFLYLRVRLKRCLMFSFSIFCRLDKNVKERTKNTKNSFMVVSFVAWIDVIWKGLSNYILGIFREFGCVNCVLLFGLVCESCDGFIAAITLVMKVIYLETMHHLDMTANLIVKRCNWRNSPTPPSECPEQSKRKDRRLRSHNNVIRLIMSVTSFTLVCAVKIDWAEAKMILLRPN